MKRLQLLDYGRFLAAFMVLCYHYTYKGVKDGMITSLSIDTTLASLTKYGHYGVEFFFMISGFVIHYSIQHKDSKSFAATRMKRLLPMYWAAVLLTATIGWLFQQPEILEVSFQKVMANLTMVPGKFGFGNLDSVYWTLIYEIKFYLFVFVILLMQQKKHMVMIFLVWGALIVLKQLFDLTIPFADIYYLLFISGALFAEYMTSKSKLILVFIGIMFFVDVYVFSDYFGLDSLTKFVVLIASFFLFFTLQISRWGQGLNLLFSKQLGALTYPIYLIHGGIGYLLLSNYANEDYKYLFWIITTVLILTVAWILQKIVEQKMSRYWSSVFFKVVNLPRKLKEFLTRN